MKNLVSGKSKNKLKYFVLIGICFIAVAAYAIETPLDLKNMKTNESSAVAQTNPLDLAKARNCLTCHSIATKIVGPAFKDVGAKYSGQKDALDKLMAKVLKGGSGSWGTKPMPPNTQVSKTESQILVKWILTMK